MIDPRKPDYDMPPGAAGRPCVAYAPRGGEATAAPEVSVITPFHDDLEEFFETERCVLGQTLQSFEWIIINDASTNPRSLDILDLFRAGARDARIRVIDQPVNQGPGAARNRGTKEARAEFIFQLDSDDLIEPSTLEKCLIYLRTHPRCAMVKGYSVAFGARRHTYEKGFHCRAEFLTRNCATITAMIRREAFLAVGGFDESIRAGMEDWDLWLRLADAGFWGDTIPEYFDWYRRRASHADQWHDWDDGERQKQFAERVREKYAGLRARGFPRTREPLARPCQPVRRAVPWRNPLAKSARRVLMILPWMRMGGADKFNLDLVAQLRGRGWEVTIATTTGTHNGWMPRFAALTPDIFVLPALAGDHDLLPILRGLIDSRDPDVVLISNAEAGYAELPALRALCPGRAWVDYNHMEEEEWRFGGHPRSGVNARSQLDLSITASAHLRAWMVARGTDPARTEVCTINVDAQEWKPDADARARVRERLSIAPDEPVILYAGRLCAQKQPEVFARTLGLLARAGQRFTALVAGDGEDRAMLERRLRELGATEHVRMLGECTSEQMRELMPASDIFFLPSKWEGIALVLYEAMSAGAAVVGAEVGGQRELVTPECGVLLPKAAPGREAEDEPPAYARAIETLLRDPEARRAMSARARERIERHFALSAMGERMEALLERASTLARTEPRPAIDPILAFDIADRSAEARRMARAADRLWQEGKRLRDELAAKSAALVEAKPAAPQPGSGAPRSPAAPAVPAAPAKGASLQTGQPELGPATPPEVIVRAQVAPRQGVHANGTHANGSHGPGAHANGMHNRPASREGGKRRAPEPAQPGARRPGGGPGAKRGKSSGAARAGRPRGPHPTQAQMNAAPFEDPEVRAKRQLTLIQASRAWRAVQRLKRNPAYALYARARWGRGWRQHAAGGSAAQQLLRITTSRSYRLILWTKSTRLYRLTRGKAGKGAAMVEPKVSPASPKAVSREVERVQS